MENKKKFKINWKENIVVFYVLTYLLTVVGQILGGILVSAPIGAYYGFQAVSNGADATDTIAIANAVTNSLSSNPFVNTSMMYAATIGEWIVCLLVMLRKKNRPLFKTFLPAVKGNTLLFLLLGIAIGFVLNGACILGAFLHKDISLTLATQPVLQLILVFIFVFIQSSAEEVICRGYLFQKLIKRYKKPVVAILGNSLFFSFLHIFNDNVTVLSLLNIALSGILFSLIVYYFDSLWCAFAAHAAWNYTQNIIFGLPNSGILVDFSIFKLDRDAAKDSFAYNVGFGVEGTLLAVIVLAIACVAVYLIGSKKGLTPTNIWPEEAVESVEAQPEIIATSADNASTE